MQEKFVVDVEYMDNKHPIATEWISFNNFFEALHFGANLPRGKLKTIKIKQNNKDIVVFRALI